MGGGVGVEDEGSPDHRVHSWGWVAGVTKLRARLSRGLVTVTKKRRRVLVLVPLTPVLPVLGGGLLLRGVELVLVAGVLAVGSLAHPRGTLLKFECQNIDGSE